MRVWYSQSNFDARVPRASLFERWVTGTPPCDPNPTPTHQSVGTAHAKRPPSGFVQVGISSANFRLVRHSSIDRGKSGARPRAEVALVRLHAPRAMIVP